MPQTSFKILDVLAISFEPAVKTGVLALPHAHTGCHRPRTDFANAPKAWRRSPHMAPEPQPRSGALAAAAAGQAGAAVENPYAATAALSDAPGIARQSRPRASQNDRMGYAARSPTGGQNVEDRPALAELLRPRQGRVSAVQIIGNSFLGALNLFLPVQTYPCLGHCTTRGISLRRQATIFRLCGATFFSGTIRPREQIGMRPAGLGRYGATASAMPAYGSTYIAA